MIDNSFLRNIVDKGCVTLIESEPSLGKTGLALSLMLSAAENGLTPLYISLEYSTDRLMEKLLAIFSGISLRKIAAGKEAKTLDESKSALSSLRISIKSMIRPLLPDVTSIIEKHCKENQADIVFIDYLGLIRSGGENAVSVLKKLAESFDIPIVTLEQIPRGCYAGLCRGPEAEADLSLRLIRDGEKAKLSNLKGRDIGLDLIFNPETTGFSVCSSHQE